MIAASAIDLVDAHSKATPVKALVLYGYLQHDTDKRLHSDPSNCEYHVHLHSQPFPPHQEMIKK
jgi:hypothetical protein